MKVIFQMVDGTEKAFEDVTEVKGNMFFDTFSNAIEVFQMKKKIKIKQSEIDGFEISQ
jgi:hypothetical protein